MLECISEKSNEDVSSHVFDVYTWNVDSNPYTDVGGRLIPSRIPLSAFIAGKCEPPLYSAKITDGCC